MKRVEKNKKSDLILSFNKKDFRFDCFRGSGKGGQKRNKTSSYVRCTHEPSRVSAVGQEGRSQYKNKQIAFRKVAESKQFKNWLKIFLSKTNYKTVKSVVDEQMDRKNIIIEVFDSSKGKWVEWME